MTRFSPGRGATAALAALLVLAAAPSAFALVDGQPQTLWKKHTVQGNGTLIGNALMGIGPLAQNVNARILSPSETLFDLQEIPADGSLVAAYLFWSGSLREGGLEDRFVTVSLPDGASQPNVAAESCRILPRSGNGISSAYYCRSDVTTLLRAHQQRLADGTLTLNGTYNLTDVDAAVGTPNGSGGSCNDPADPCQSAYAGWSMAIVWSSSTVTSTKEIMLYDGFLRMDEICDNISPSGVCGTGSTGVSNPITLGGFNAINRSAQVSFFALEGDSQLGAPPEPDQNQDFMCLGNNPFDGNTRACRSGMALGGVGAAQPRNLFDSTVPRRFASFSGVDIKTLPAQLPAAGGFPPLTTSVQIVPGSGDNVPDVGPFFNTQGILSNGELFYLGLVMLSVDTVAPNFRSSVKRVDKTTAAPGDTLTYTMRVENSGTWAASATLKDVLGADLEYVAGSTTLRGNPVPDVGGQSALATGLNLGNLTPVISPFVDVTFKVRIKSTFAGGTLCNIADLDASYQVIGQPQVQLPTLQLKTNPCTTVQLPNVQKPLKAVLINGNATNEAKPNDSIRYSIRLLNSGAQTAAGISLVDDIPKFLENVRVQNVPGGAVVTLTATGGAFGNGQLKVDNITLPSNFPIDVIIDADVLDDAAFTLAGGTDGEAIANRARLSGPPINPALADSDDPATPLVDATTIFVRFGVALATSRKTVTGDTGGFVAPGAPLTYTIRLTNAGSRPATASLADDLPPNVGGCAVVSGPILCAAGGTNGTGKVTGSGITVGPGASVDVSFRVNVASGAPNGATITNVGQLSASERPNVTWNVTAPTLTVRSAVVFAVSKTVTDVNGGGIEPGDELDYAIVIRNTGNRSSTAVSVKDALDANLTFVSATAGGTLAAGTVGWSGLGTPALASIAPGAAVTLAFRARINSVPNGTVISNQASVASAEASALSDDPGTAAANDPTLVRVIAAPSFVESTKSVVDQNGGQVRPGDVLEWSIGVRNSGRAPGTNVVISDAVDPSLTVVAITNGGVQSGSTITWTLPLLAAGATAPSLTYTTRVNSPLANGTVLANQAFVRSDEAPSAVPTDDAATPAADDPTRVTVTSVVSLATSTKTVADDNGGSPLPGDRLTWTIRVIATGDAPATDVTVLDTINRCLTNVVPQNGGTFDGAAIRWSRTGTPALANVLPGTPVNLTFNANIAAGTSDGTACPNQAGLLSASTPAPTLSDDPATPALNDPTIILVVSKPVLSASTKVATLINDANGDGTFSPGDQIRYTIAVKNTGSETARGVALSDVLSPLLTNVTASAGGIVAGGNATWSIGDLAPLTDRTVTLDATIVKPLDDGTTLDNQGRLTAANLTGPILTDDPATAAPNDPTRLLLKSAPKFVVTKTVLDVNGGRVEPVDLLRYTVKLKNEGTSLARAVKLRDVLAANLVFVSSSAGTFDAATRTVSLDLPSLDLVNEITFTIDARIAAGLDNGTAIDNQTRTTSTELTVPQLSDDPSTAALADPTRVIVISAADLSTSTKRFVDRNAGDLRPADLVDYTITVRNTGNAVARALVVTDVVDPRLAVQLPIDQGGVLGANNTVTWTLAQPLGLGGSLDLKLAVRLAVPLPDGTEFSNQASLNAQALVTPFLTDDPTTAAPSDPTKFKIKSAPSLTATKVVNDVNGGEVRPGDELQYTLTLKNTGDAEATGGVLTDVLDANLDFVSASGGGTFDATSRTVRWTVARVGISPNDASFTLDARLKRPLANGVVVANQGRLTVAELGAPTITDDPSTPGPLDPTRVTVVARPDLTKSEKRVTDLNGGDFGPEDEIEYAITVKNTGDNAATNVVISDALDALLTNIVPLDGGTFDATSRAVTWRVPSVDLSPAGDRILRVRAKIAPLLASGTRISNQGSLASSQTPTPVLTDDPTTALPDDATILTVISAPQLQTSTKVVVDQDGGLVRPGDQLLYTVVVKNSGNTFANDVVVEDAIDPLLTDLQVDAGGVFTAGKIRWDRTTTPSLARLAPNTAGVTLTFRAKIASGARNGTAIANQALLASAEGVRAPTDNPGTPAIGDPTEITLLFPDLARTTKTVLDINGGDVEPGDVLTFTIRVANDGALPATDVVVADLFDLVNLVDIVPESGGVLTGANLTWTKTTTPALASVTQAQPVELVVNARVKPLTANGTVVANQASITARELLLPVLSDADLATPAKDPARVTVVSRPILSTSTLVAEDPNGDEVRPGDRLAWHTTVKNSGNTFATETVVTLVLPAELTDVTLDTRGTLSGLTITWDKTTVPALASIEPGKDVTLTFSGTVRRPMRNGTSITAQGRIVVRELTGDNVTDDPSTGVVGDPTTVRVFSAPRLVHSEKTITDLNGGRLEPGDEVLYEIVVLNDGTESATNVRVTDSVPGGTTYVAGSFTLNGQRVDDSAGFPLTNGLVVRSPKTAAAAGEVLVDDGVAPDDEVVAIQFRAHLSRQILTGTAVSNQAMITSETTRPAFTDDPNTPMLGDATVVVVGHGPAVVATRLGWKLLEDLGEPGAVNPGDVVELTLEVPNAGTSPIACLVSTLPLDARLTPVGGLSLNGTPLTAAGGDDDGEWTTSASGETAVVRLGEIAPRGVATVRLQARASTSADGLVFAQARVACEPGFSQPSDSDPSLPGAQPATIPIRGSGIGKADLRASTKTVVDLNGGEIAGGDELRYSLTITNDGSAAAKDVTLTDVLPTGLTFVPGSASGDNGFVVEGQTEEGSSIVSATLASLAPGQRATATFRATVAAGPSGRTLLNRAFVRADGLEPLSLVSLVTLGGMPGTATLVGRVWEDLDGDGGFARAQDQVYPAFQAQLVSRAASSDAVPVVVKSIFTDANGEYSLVNLPPGDYDVVFRAPDGAEYARRTASGLASAETRVVDAELFPTGIVHRAGDRTPIAGARVVVHYDDTMVGLPPPACDENTGVISVVTDLETGVVAPRRVGAKCFPDGQQGQRTLENGAYRLTFPDALSPVGYRLSITLPSSALAFPSTSRPPESGVAPPGRVSSARRPENAGKGEPYYTRFAYQALPDEVTQNHIPIDALEDLVRISKEASRGSVHTGEFVTYTVAVANGSSRDLVAHGGASGFSIVDAFPAGMRYVRGSTRAIRRTITGDGCARLGTSVTTFDCAEGRQDPSGALEGTGRLGRFGPYDVKAGETLVLRYTLAVTSGAKAGDHDNIASGSFDSVKVTKDAIATVRVMWDALFDESTIIGKVFCDTDGNGLQTPGEEGLGLARVYADNGFYVEADTDGKFHFIGLRPGLHLFKLDLRSLPPGSEAGDNVRRSLYLTAGLDTRVNFPVKCDLEEVKPDRVRLLSEKSKDLPPEPLPDAPAPPVTILGSTNPLEVTIDGLELRPPMAEVVLTLGNAERSSAANVGVNGSGEPEESFAFRVLPLPGPAARSWTFTIAGEDEKPLYVTSGAGAAPALLAWNGRDDAGALQVRAGGRYLYRLRLVGGAGSSYTTAARAFGFGWVDSSAHAEPAPPAAAPITKTLTGAYFGAKDAKAKGPLIVAVAGLVPQIPKGASLIGVAVHADPADGKDAQKLTEARAQSVQELFIAQGISAERLVVVGRGTASLAVETPVTPKGKKVDGKALAAAQEANRRIVVTIEPPLAPPPPPATVRSPALQSPSITVAGQQVEPGADHRFRFDAPRPEIGSIPVRVVAPNGSAIDAEWKPGPRVSSLPPGPLLVQLDTRRGLAAVASAELSLPLLSADVLLAGGGIVELADTAPRTPLRFTVNLAAAVATWQLTLKDGSGVVVYAFEGTGAPPAELLWDGRASGKPVALRPGTYSYQLTATDPAGNKLATGKRSAVVFRPPQAISTTVPLATLFAKPTAVKLQLSAKKALKDIARRLVTAEGSLVVEAHTDAPETVAATNDQAEAVRAMLITLGVPAERLTAVGRGTSSPIAPNLNKKGREKNRRIEIRNAAKLPLLPDRTPTLIVRVAGQLAEDLGDGLYRVTLPSAPTGPLEIELEGSTGRQVSYRIEPPPPELHEDRAGASRRAVTRAVLAQAGDDLPPLPEMDLPPLPEDPLPAESADAGTPAPVATPAPVLATTPAEPATATVTDVVLAEPPPIPVDAPPPMIAADEPVVVIPMEPAVRPLPADEIVGEKVLIARYSNEAPETTVALKLLARLPRDRSTLHSHRLLVAGLADPRNKVTLNGRAVKLDRGGRFAEPLDLATGETHVLLEATDPDGNISSIERHYSVDTTGLFLMGIADGGFGGAGGELAGTDTLGLKVGGVRRLFLGGRVAGTASGELDASRHLRGWFKSLKLAANLDTARRNDDSAFRDLIDPSRYYPVFGDASTLVQEAPARGPVYLRFDADDSHALFGDFRTGLGGSELFRYDRTLYGADLTLKREWTPKVTTQLQLMGAPGDARLRHGHVELRATGGSLYYLQGGNVVEGTERVRIVVRDRDTGVELSRQDRLRYTDYFVTYGDGRLLFKQPVSSTQDAAFLVNNNLSTALAGHPVFVVVDYEYRDIAGDAGGVVGAHTRESFFGGLLSVGGGFLQESRGAADPYRLWGVELGTRKSDRTFARAEFARSNGSDANSFFSSDGGLTYSPMAAQCASPDDPGCRTSGNGWKLEAGAELAELLGRTGELLSGRAYFQSLDAGYFANGALFEQGTMKYGALLRLPLSPKDALALRHDSVESVLDRDLTLPGIQRKTVIRRLTGLQYRHTEEKWGAVGEYANALTLDTGALGANGKAGNIATDTVLLGGNYRPFKQLNLLLNQEGILRGDPRLLASGWKDHLTTTLGAQYSLTERLTATLTESIRWSGENATQLGLSTQLSDTTQLYLNERLSSRAGQFVSTTLVGGNAELAKGMRAYGEYQLDGVASGAQNRAVLGLNNRWTLREGLILSAGYERTQTVGDGASSLSSGGVVGASPGASQGSVLGTPPFSAPGLNPAVAISPGAASRDVGSFGVEYLAKDTFKASARLEGRFDNADPKYAAQAGVADRLQLALLSTVDWKWSDDLSFISRLIYADTFAQAPAAAFSKILENALEARYLEATAGFAFRPKLYDWVAVLFKVSRVIDRRPTAMLNGWDTQTSDVVSISPSFETPFRFGFSQKLAYKHVRSLEYDRDFTNHVLLNVSRVDYHVLQKLDLTAEYRVLLTSLAAREGDTGIGQGDVKHGAVFEVAYRPLPFVRLGAGYSFASFSDNELARLDENAGGLFVRATGQY